MIGFAISAAVAGAFLGPALGAAAARYGTGPAFGTVAAACAALAVSGRELAGARGGVPERDDGSPRSASDRSGCRSA